MLYDNLTEYKSTSLPLQPSSLQIDLNPGSLGLIGKTCLLMQFLMQVSSSELGRVQVSVCLNTPGLSNICSSRLLLEIFYTVLQWCIYADSAFGMHPLIFRVSKTS